MLQVLVWDVRSPGSPQHVCATPAGAGVLRLALGPWGDVLAVSTVKGLHCLELFDLGAPMSSIAATFPLARPYSDIAFNAVTHNLYAGSASGAVHVYARLA